MQTEIEAKFLNVDHDTLRTKLQALGATCEQPNRLMRRQNYDLPGRIGDPVWARVRDEGHQVTMSYKRMDGQGLHDTKEICLTVDSYDQADAFMRALGMVPTGYQETKRESWRLGDVEIDLDEWPWLPTYCEVEGPDEASVRDVAAKLELDMSQARHGSVVSAYEVEYDTNDKEINDIERITFELPTPDWLAAKRRSEVVA